jgi:hypothetical protein
MIAAIVVRLSCKSRVRQPRFVPLRVEAAGHLTDKGFEHPGLPAIAEADKTHHLPMRRKGEALFPEKGPLATLEEIRCEIGPCAFGAQYQQNAVPPDGATIRWDWFDDYDEQPSRTELLLESERFCAAKNF